MNKKFFGIAALVSVSVLSAGCSHTVDPGNVGARVDWGVLDPTPLESGFYWLPPIGAHIIDLNYQSKQYENTTETFTKDLQKVTIRYRVNFAPLPAALPSLYKNKGDDYANQIIPAIVVSQLKNHFGTYTAPEVVSKRQQLGDAIKAAIEPQLRAQNITLNNFALMDTSFETDYSNAVEAKQVAVQNAEAEQNRTVQVTEKGKQAVIAAKADAEAIQVKSEALKSSPGYTDYMRVMRWNGQYPATVYCAASTPCFGK